MEKAGRILPALQSHKERALGAQPALPVWRLGTGNPVYPLGYWEQLSLSEGLLSPVKLAHNSH